MSIPIAIRTCNRAVFLDTTLKSILATELPEDIEIVIIDDCSTDEVTKKYLFTNEEITLEEEYVWPTTPKWIGKVGEIPNVSKLVGIKDKFEIVQPESRKGVRGGIFYCIDYMMEKYPNSEAIIVIEADVVFHKDWYKALMDGYNNCKDEKGPNGDKLGLLSCYDRRGRNIKTDYGWGWRSVKKLSNGNISCGNGIGGCQYLVTREFYNRANIAFKKTHHPRLRSGDTALQACCFYAECNIAITVPSMIQHVGILSLAWPTKGWRHCVNFLKPLAWRNEI